MCVTVSGRDNFLALRTYVSGCHKLFSPGWVQTEPSAGREYSVKTDPCSEKAEKQTCLQFSAQCLNITQKVSLPRHALKVNVNDNFGGIFKHYAMEFTYWAMPPMASFIKPLLHEIHITGHTHACWWDSIHRQNGQTYAYIYFPCLACKRSLFVSYRTVQTLHSIIK